MKVKTTKFDYFEICTLENYCAVNKATPKGKWSLLCNKSRIFALMY